jgi:diacylglycerol kinase family enzyme
MDNTDAVLVAGGDGTIMEAVTGSADCFPRWKIELGEVVTILLSS